MADIGTNDSDKIGRKGAGICSSDNRIAFGDHVIITGGDVKRMTLVHTGGKLKLGRTGTVRLDELVGLRHGEVLRHDQKRGVFVPTNAYPDLDITTIEDTVEDVRDNRHLVDNNQSQTLSNAEITEVRREKGVDELLTSLVEKSTTFHTKTAYSQEKYLQKKKKRHGILYKVDRVTPDEIAEIYLPTINPSSEKIKETRWIRLRADTMALILHHSGVCSGSHVLLYDKTNGHLEATLLTRIGGDGMLLQLMDKVAQPNTFMAQAMGLSRIKELWKAIPRNEGFLLGTESSEDDGKAVERKDDLTNEGDVVSQWLRGIEARRMLKDRPADALIVVHDDAESLVAAVADLFPFLALCGRVVAFSPFLEDLTDLFMSLRSGCVNISISETWYRHHQILPNRTHPTVNMNTAGGYLLTAIKVAAGKNMRSCVNKSDSSLSPNVPWCDGEVARKRARQEIEEEKRE